MKSLGRTLIGIALTTLTASVYADNEAAANAATDQGFARTAETYVGGPWEGHPAAAALRYQEGVGLYEQGQYDEALIQFRQAALVDPETPHLAFYMIHAEREQEREQAQRLSEEKRREFETLVAAGRDGLGQKRYTEAHAKLQEALALEPKNPAVQVLEAQAKDLPRTDNDPKAAEQHYEAGLVAYAKNDLQDARKEWLITAKLDGDHPKVNQALKRVDQELGLKQNPDKASGQ